VKKIDILDINIKELSIYSSLRENNFKEDNSFIADSPKVVNLILQTDIEVKSLLATQEYFDEFEDLLKRKDIPYIYITTKDEMKKIVGHKIHHNCMLHGIRPQNIDISKVKSDIVLLDGITSSENVGSIVRSCAAIGVSNIFITKHTPHPFNRRALRVSMGHAPLINTFIYQDIKTTLEDLKKKGYKIFAAEVQKDSVALSKVKIDTKWVLVLGHEGRGISQDILDICDEVVSIEMQSGIKSFNVSVAAALIMYQFKNNR
jgi:tRNA G18 (ribose-2'-O)-methylase SpoU